MNISIHIKKKHYFLTFLWLALAIGSAILCGFFIIRYRRLSYVHWLENEKSAIKQTKDAAQDLLGYIDILRPIVDSLAQELSNKTITEAQLDALLRKAKSSATITGVGVAYIPYAFDASHKLFSRYWVDQGDGNRMVKVEEVYDYTDKKYMWFHKPLKDGAGFLEPYRSGVMDSYLAEYAAPIYRTDANGKKKPIGVVFANQSVEHLQHIIETLLLGRTGYWFILSAKGSFLAYPQLKYKLKTIFDIARDLRNPGLEQAAQKILKGESVVFEYNNEITGALSWLISSRIGNTPWSVVGVFDQEEFYKDFNFFRHALMVPSVAFFFSMFFLVLFIAMVYKKNIYLWSFLSTLISFAIFIQIIWMWYAIYHYPYKRDEPNIYRVESKLKLFEYLEKNFPASATLVEPKYENLTLKQRLLKIIPYKHLIPTGVYINSLQLAEASEIKLSAYFWQRFTKGMHDKIPQGFVFIQTNDANIIEETAVEQVNDKLITYDVFAKLNQFLTYTLYPFDMKSLRIKYWSKTSSETFFFIPDLNSYQLINPRSLPGVDPDVYIPGWSLVGSYFGYQKMPYTTNFGAYNIGALGVYDELDISSEGQPFFEVVIRRNLSDALVSDLIPISVIAVLLFLVLLISGPAKDRYLTAIASIFFATIFAQIRFRSKIPQAQIVYLENLYFILYVIMLILLIVCFFVQNKIKIPYITADNNILIKLLYWPFLFGSFAIVTVVYLW